MGWVERNIWEDGKKKGELAEAQPSQ